MRRGASVLVFGCLAAAAIVQGACSSDDSTTAPPVQDAGKDSTTPIDSGQSTCSGAVPVLAIAAGDGTPDLSCYEADAAYLMPMPLLGDDGGDDADTDGDVDAGEDASDAGAPDTGTDTGVDSGPGTDSGTDAGTDAGTDGGAGGYSVNVLEFVTRQPTDGIAVQIYAGPSALGTPFFSGTTSGGGLLNFSIPNGMAVPQTVTFSSAGTGYTPSNLYDTPLIPAPNPTIDYTISSSNFSILAASILGSEPLSATKTVIVSAARDCQARDMSGAILELVDAETNTVITTDKSPGGARVVYFNTTGLPDTSCSFTNSSQAIWTVLNAPINVDSASKTITHKYSVRMSGRRSLSDTAPVVLNTVPVELWGSVGNVVRPYKQSPPK
jgi:hypothetical protein